MATFEEADAIARTEAVEQLEMADERETAQWYTAQGIGPDRVMELFKRYIVTALLPHCFAFGQLVNWHRLPEPAKHVLRIELARVKAEGERNQQGIDRKEASVKDEDNLPTGPLTVQPCQADHGASLVIHHPNRSIIAYIPPTNEDEDPDADTAKREPWDVAYAQLFAAAPDMLAALETWKQYETGLFTYSWSQVQTAVDEAIAKARRVYE